MQRFDPVSGDYSRFRPDYPASLLTDLVACVASPQIKPVRWIDVGCGTGIFTRQLAKALPASACLMGVEPSERMREQAASHGDDISYVKGTAEALPAQNGDIDAVSAATAAHWFDRPRFYSEAMRVLKGGGILAIVEYIRDVENSPAAAALEAYLAQEGGPKAYVRPDYEAEFSALDGFETIHVDHITTTFHLDGDAYVGLALSSSHAASCIARLGRKRVCDDLTRIGAGLAQEDGLISYIYRFHMFVARKTD